MSTSTAPETRSGTGNGWKTGLMAGCLAAIANALLYLLTRGMGVTLLAHIGKDGQAEVIPISEGRMIVSAGGESATSKYGPTPL